MKQTHTACIDWFIVSYDSANKKKQCKEPSCMETSS